MATAAKAIVILSFFIFGILLGSLFFLSELDGGYCFGAVVFILASCFFLVRNLKLLCSGLTLLALGFFYAMFFGQWHRELDATFLKLPMRAYVVSSPVIKNDSQYFSVKSVADLGGVNKVVAPLNPTVRYGNEIEINGKIYSFFPETIIYVDEFLVINPDKRNFREMIFAFRNNFVASIRNSLPTKEGGLLAGITVGDRSMIPSKFDEAMKNSGISHMTALSGYNVSVLVFTVGIILQPLLRRKVLLVATVCFLLIFILSTGGEASIVRAGLMGFLALSANFFGRQYSFWHSTLFTALLMLLFNPFVVWIDPGFSLSFVALFGISYFLTPIKTRLSRFHLFARYPQFSEAVSISLAAQICVVPILIFWFGKFQLFGLIPNIILGPLIPLLMALGFILGVIGSVSSVIGSLFALVMLPLLNLVVKLIEFFAEFPILTMRNFGWFLGTIYLAVLGILLYREHPEKYFKNDEA